MGIDAFTLAYQKAPIAFNGGIAANVSGGLLPMMSITEAASFAGGITSGSESLPLEDFLFDFYPMPGGTLAEFQIGAYPFANQQVAANAIIGQPLHISFEMLAPARGSGAYATKLAALSALQAAIQQHAALGGTYTAATPSYLYTNLILLSFRDISGGDPKRPQDRWQWDFIQPLLTLQAAQAAQGTFYQKATAGAPLTPGPNGALSYGGTQTTVGAPASGVGPSVVPAAQTLPAASVAGSPPTTPSGTG